MRWISVIARCWLPTLAGSLRCCTPKAGLTLLSRRSSGERKRQHSPAKAVRQRQLGPVDDDGDELDASGHDDRRQLRHAVPGGQPRRLDGMGIGWRRRWCSGWREHRFAGYGYVWRRNRRHDVLELHWYGRVLRGLEHHDLAVEQRDGVLRPLTVSRIGGVQRRRVEH